MPRIKGNELVVCRVSRQAKDALLEIARKDQRSMAAVLRDAIRLYLNNGRRPERNQE